MRDIKNYRRLKVAVVWSWDFHCDEMYYDGPWLDIQIGPIAIAWNKDGLPYIFQDKGD